MALYRRGTERPDALDLVSPLRSGSRDDDEDLCSRSTCWPSSRRGGWSNRGTWPGPGAGIGRPSARLITSGLRGTAPMRMIAQHWHTELARPVGDVGRRPADDPRHAPPGPRRCGRVRGLRSVGVVHAHGGISGAGTACSTSRRENPGRRCPAHEAGSPLRVPVLPAEPRADRGDSSTPGGSGDGSRSGAGG